MLYLRKIVNCPARVVDPKVSQIRKYDVLQGCICIIGRSKGARVPSYFYFLAGALISGFGPSSHPRLGNVDSQLFHRGSTWTGKLEIWENSFQSGNFEQTGKVSEYWKAQGISDKYYSTFLVIFKRTVHYLQKWIKFQFKKKQNIKKNTGNGKNNNGKVREFCQSEKM